MSTPDAPHGPDAPRDPAAGDQPPATPDSPAGLPDGGPPVDDAETIVQSDAGSPIGSQPAPGPPSGDDGPPPSNDDGPPPPNDDGPPPPSDLPPPGGGAAPWPSIGGRRLYRRSDDRVIAGVASGLGDYFGIDPAIIRLAFVGLAIFGGSGFLLYLLGWVFLPVRDSGTSVGEGLVRKVGGGRSAGGLVLIIVAAVVILDSTRFFGGSLFWAALLIGVGVLLFRSDGDSDGEPGDRRQTPAAGRADERPAAGASSDSSLATRAQPPGVAPTTTAVSQEVYDELPPPPPGLYDDWRPTPRPAPPEPPPPPSVLGRVTVAAALIVVGAVALLDNVTGLDVPIASYAALALTTIGAGLLVGARWGRARGLIALGAVALVVLVATSFVPRLPTGGAGQRAYTPQSADQLQQPYELGFGELVLDLTQLELQPAQDVTVEATMGVGSLKVTVPDGVGVEVDAVAEIGTVKAFDRTSDGTDARVSFSEPGAEGSPTIVLDLRNSIGEIDVQRAPVGVN